MTPYELYDAETGERLAIVPQGDPPDRLHWVLAARLAATGRLVVIRDGIDLLWLYASERPEPYGWDECHWWGPHIGITHRLLPEFGGTDENGLLYPAWAKANPTLTPMSPERADFLIPFQSRGRLSPLLARADALVRTEPVPVELVEAVMEEANR